MEQKLDISNIEFSNNDFKNQLKVHSNLSAELAHLLGIQVGDGYLKKKVRGTTVDYVMCYDGNVHNECDWYEHFLKNLIFNLFGKTTNIRKTKSNTVNISYGSKAIFHFIRDVCGVQESPKINIDAPLMIKNGSLLVKTNFLKGLADTDFSVILKKNNYPVIDYQTSSENLHLFVKSVLDELGFNYCSGFRKMKRLEKFHDSYYIQISGRKNLQKWLDTVNFSSYKHLRKSKIALGTE